MKSAWIWQLISLGFGSKVFGSLLFLLQLIDFPSVNGRSRHDFLAVVWKKILTKNHRLIFQQSYLLILPNSELKYEAKGGGPGGSVFVGSHFPLIADNVSHIWLIFCSSKLRAGAKINEQKTTHNR